MSSHPQTASSTSPSQQLGHRQRDINREKSNSQPFHPSIPSIRPDQDPDPDRCPPSARPSIFFASLPNPSPAPKSAETNRPSGQQDHNHRQAPASDPSQHPHPLTNSSSSNNNNHSLIQDSDAEGSVEIIEETDPDLPPSHHPPSTLPPGQGAIKGPELEIILPTSPSPSSTHPDKLSNDPLSFTIPPEKVYSKLKLSKTPQSKPSAPPTTRRQIVTVGTSDEGEDEVQVSLKPKLKRSNQSSNQSSKLRKRKKILSDSEDERDHHGDDDDDSDFNDDVDRDEISIVNDHQPHKKRKANTNRRITTNHPNSESEEIEDEMGTGSETSEPDTSESGDESIRILRNTRNSSHHHQPANVNRSNRPITKKLRRRIDLDDSDDDLNQSQLSDDQDWQRHRSDSDSDDHDPHNRTVSEDDALRFFNECDVSDLPAVTACSLEQAKTIVSCRPFKDAEDMKRKLRKKKGVNSGVLNHYQDMMKGYFEVDRVLSQCEKHGQDLSTIMNIWAGRSKESANDNGESLEDSASKLNAEGAIDLTDHLTNPVSLQSEEERRAFKNYIFDQPSSIPSKIRLKSYQMLGLNWLNLLYSQGLSCILADEMGLGKTAQVVCFLSHLKLVGKLGPHLVIVPSSTLDNWIREFSNFSQNLIVRAYYGSQSDRSELRYELKSSKDLDVIITTYNIATGNTDDRKFLDRMRFDACVYDEGHQLKNSQSKRYKDLMRQNVRWRLLLTGTPLQNNLQELVSLLSFILPKIFLQAEKDLRMIFKVPTEAQANLLAQTRITRAKKMMSPFVLRRKKNQVLKDLPKKIEKVIYCDLEPEQSVIYNQIIKRSKKYLIQPNSTSQDQDQQFNDELFSADLIEDEEINFKNNGLLGGPNSLKSSNQKKKIGTYSTTSNVLMELRKASNHPLLFRSLYDDQQLKSIARACLNELSFMDSDLNLIIEDLEIMNDFEIHNLCKTYPKSLSKFCLALHDQVLKSGKLHTLKEILLNNNNGDRFLIFSQFTQMLEILKVFLNSIGVKFLTLTGQTNVVERQPLVDEFTNDLTITVFLLSTKAGGLGLNLMSANVVIIFDQDFNPHNDRQAEDRAYRLGQSKDVKVFKFISKSTIEEDILQLTTMKLEIDNSISSSKNISSINLADTNVNSIQTSTSSSASSSTTTTTTNINNNTTDDLLTINNPLNLEKNLKNRLISNLRHRLLSSNSTTSV